MPDLPDDVVAALARGVAAYVRAVPRHELPNQLRPLQAFRPKAMAARKSILVDALDDDTFRNNVLVWLDEIKPDLAPEDAAMLRLACERSEGWDAQLAALSAEDEPAEQGARPDPAVVEQTLERERDKVARARADAKRARADAAAEVEALRRGVAELERKLEELNGELSAARDARTAAEARLAAADAASAKGVRRAERAAEAATAARARAERDLKAARKEGSAARRDADKAARRIEELEAELRGMRAAAETEPAAPQPPRGVERKPLQVPRGRFDDDPQTLDGWLSTDGVRLLVDGYNVTKAEGGFGELELETQRDRLLADVVRLAERKRVETTIVFDGSEVEPAARRVFRGRVKVEYSVPGETADDHLVALLERLPPGPVVVATNDRELQERLRALGATIATSNQLLALIR